MGSALFSVNALPNRTTNTRLGIVISKKVAAKAVERNLLKRRFRDAGARLYEKLPSGYDVVVNIKPKAKEVDFSEIERELGATFGKVGTDETPRHRHN